MTILFLAVKCEKTRDDSALGHVSQTGFLKLEPDISFDAEIRNLRHAAQLRQKDGTIEALRGQLETSNEKLEKSDQKCISLSIINRGLGTQWKETLYEKKISDDLFSSLHQQIDELQSNKKDLEAQVKASVLEKRQSEVRCFELGLQLESEKQDIEAKLAESRLNNLSLKKVHGSQTKLLNKRNQITQERVEQLGADLRKVKAQNEGLQKDLQNSDASIKSLTQDVERLNKDNIVLSEGLQQVVADTILEQAKMQKIESDLRRVRKERDDLQTQFRALKQKQSDVTECDALKSQLHYTTADLDQVKLERDELRGQVENYTQAQTDQKSQCLALQRKLDQAETAQKSESETLRGQLDQMKKYLVKLEAELAQKTKCLSNMGALAIKHQAEFEELKEENDQLHSLRKRVAEVERKYSESFRGGKKRKLGELSEKK